ncbi:VOC family protein [Roseomonas sp. OT10]|uniref:VOC family protein n=1 Tax=Roseomonas cutis TaxID=2897332 RepID=UPI001E2AF8D2|nr:VOC family protein [Roseomonas sp. OT10]UFN51045.1 VOC family protein [Roseomonas sp. OT10]
MAELDHLVIGCDTLEQGTAWAREALGIAIAAGGAHPGWGTHNALAGLGPSLYLEVIAPDPAQPSPDRERPFGLDDPALRARLRQAPALLTYVARCDDIAALTAALGEDSEPPLRMSRGALSWQIARPRDSLDGLVPSLIEWPGGVSVAARMPDSGMRLTGFVAEHPVPERVARRLAARGLRSPEARPGSRPRLVAHLRRPDGVEVVLASGGPDADGSRP